MKIPIAVLALLLLAVVVTGQRTDKCFDQKAVSEAIQACENAHQTEHGSNWQFGGDWWPSGGWGRPNFENSGRFWEWLKRHFRNGRPTPEVDNMDEEAADRSDESNGQPKSHQIIQRQAEKPVRNQAERQGWIPNGNQGWPNNGGPNGGTPNRGPNGGTPNGGPNGNQGWPNNGGPNGGTPNGGPNGNQGWPNNGGPNGGTPNGGPNWNQRRPPSGGPNGNQGRTLNGGPNEKEGERANWGPNDNQGEDGNGFRWPGFGGTPGIWKRPGNFLSKMKCRFEVMSGINDYRSPLNFNAINDNLTRIAIPEKLHALQTIVENCQKKYESSDDQTGSIRQKNMGYYTCFMTEVRQICRSQGETGSGNTATGNPDNTVNPDNTGNTVNPDNTGNTGST